VKILPIYWNWHASLKENSKIKIYHWSGCYKIKLLKKLQEDLQLIRKIKKLLACSEKNN